MAGNGTLGILIFGEKEISITLDRVNLWDKRIPKENKDLLFTYDHLVDSLNNNYKEAYRLFDECYNHPYSTKLNAGIIKTGIQTNDTDHGEIDYFNGIVEYIASSNSVKGYVDANINVIVLSFAKPCNFKIHFPSYFYKKDEDMGLEYPEPIIEKDGYFTIIKQPMYDEELFSIISYEKGTKYYITVITNDHIDLAKQTILAYIKDESENFNKHINSYLRYFAKSNIVTPDKAINEQFNLVRYYFFANSRKKYPCTLQGVWTDYTDKLPPWKNDFHSDINLQKTYEPYLKLGNYSEGKVLLDFIERLMPKFRKNARTFTKTDGIYIPGVMNIEGLSIGGWPQYALNPVCQIWLIKAFDEYYRYQEDNKYLRTTVFPIFKEVEACIFQLLKLNDEGFYELGFHSSPEYFEDDIKSVFKYQTNYELTMLKYLYTTLIDYCSILNQDDRHFKYVNDRLHDFYRDDKGQLLICKNQPLDRSHRHFSHMLMHLDMKLTDPFKDKDLINKDIINLEKFGYSCWVGFSYVEAASLCAYAHDGDKAYRYLKTYTDAFIHPNGFHMNNDYKGLGNSDMTCYVFTLEANFGFNTALENMMLKNYKKKVAIFPAIPDSFKKNVSFNNLRTHGNHQVSASYKNNNLCFEIKMSKPDVIEIYNNFGNNPTLIIDGVEQNFECKMCDFITIKADKIIEYRNN